MNQVLNENITQAEIRENLRQVKKRVHLACERAGRDPKEVKLLLATKTVPVEKIKVALEEADTAAGVYFLG